MREAVQLERIKRSLISRIVGRSVRELRAIAWRRRFAEFGPRSAIAWPAKITGHHSIRFGRDVSIWAHSRLEAFNTDGRDIRLLIGDGTIIQPYVHIAAARSVEIGRGVLIASRVYISDHDHDFGDPSNPPISNHRVVVDPVHIGDSVWIGEGVLVLKGVKIGEGSVIGAGSVVTSDVPPLSVAAGNPARVIRRFDRDSREWVKV
jgi:acetyltransferase-like isoleucine patch superfamily enzyme